jgi:hypothetical protein
VRPRPAFRPSARVGEVGMQQLFLTYWFVGMIKLLFGV